MHSFIYNLKNFSWKQFFINIKLKVQEFISCNISKDTNDTKQSDNGSTLNIQIESLDQEIASLIPKQGILNDAITIMSQDNYSPDEKKGAEFVLNFARFFGFGNMRTIDKLLIQKERILIQKERIDKLLEEFDGTSSDYDGEDGQTIMITNEKSAYHVRDDVW